MKPKTPQLFKIHPAESTAVAAGLAVLIGYFLGIDRPGVIAGLTAVIAAIPAVVTWIVIQVRNRKAVKE